jgi:hypothetical protein
MAPTARQSRTLSRTDGSDPIELITGDLVRAVGALSADTLIPVCPPQRLGRGTKRLVVPHFYFGDGRDRAVPLPAALSYGHRVDVMEMCFALAGRPILIVEGKAYSMAPGRMAVLLPGVRHFETYASKSRSCRLARIVLDPRGPGMHVAEYSTRAGFISGTHTNFGGIGDAADELRRLIEAASRETLDVYAMRSILLRIVSRAAQYLLKHGRARASDGAPAAVRDAESLIRRSFAENISVADVAEAAHLSPNYLSIYERLPPVNPTSIAHGPRRIAARHSGGPRPRIPTGTTFVPDIAAS